MTKWALITGSTRGIGAGIAKRLLDDGYDVIVHGRSRQDVQHLFSEYAEHRIKYWFADLRDADAAAELETFLKQESIEVDVLVNNAGVSRDGFIIRQSVEAWTEAYMVAVLGARHMTSVVLRGMLKRRFGRIINIASILSTHGRTGQTGYAAAKGALVSMTKSLAVEVARRGVTVNAISPGFIETQMTEALGLSKTALSERIPVGRMGTADDVANMVSFLCREESSYVTGQNISVCGGLSVSLHQ